MFIREWAPILRVLWFYIAISSLVALSLGVSLLNTLLWLVEILPGLFYLSHVLLVAYDQNANPAYTALFLRYIDNCQQPSYRASQAFVLLFVVSWVTTVEFFETPDIVTIFAFLGILAIFLDARKNWIGALSLLCAIRSGSVHLCLSKTGRKGR